MSSTMASFETLAARARSVSTAPVSDDIDVRRLVRSVWRRRWLILGSMMAVGILVYLVMGRVTPSYTAYSKVALETHKAQIVTSNEVVADIAPSEQIVNGEIAVLRSYLLLDHVIANLSPALQDVLDPALRPPSLKDRITGMLPSGGNADTAPADAELTAARRQARLVNAARKAVKVYPESNSFVMVIQVEAQDPLLVMTLANAIAESYIDLQLDKRRKAVGQATDWLSERLEALKADVEAAEAAVITYETQSLIDDGGTLANASQQLSDLNGQLIEARARSATVQAELAQLETVLAEQGMETAVLIVDTPTMQPLRAQDVALRQQDAVWARTYAPDHPRRTEIRTELEEIQAVMAKEVDKVLAQRRSEVEIALLREKNIRAGIAQLEERVMQISQNRLQLKQLEREANASRMTYESLLTRITETRTQEELQQPDAKLIERAILPGVPSAPRPKLMAALAAIVVGTGVTTWFLFGEMTPTTFRTASEVEAETSLPVLSSIPLGQWADTAAALKDLRENPHGKYAERIRLLRTSLLLRNAGSNPHSILIMSSAPGEGKTTTALALAQMAALSGKSAIVVDCDLRRPKVADAMDVSMKYDFADFIDNSCELPDAIHTSRAGGFDILGARAPRYSAADALLEGWLKPVISELTRVYDLVIVDAPALLAVSDALTVAQVVDTRLYLVSCDETLRNAVTKGLAQLNDLGLHMTGMILNKVDFRRNPGVETEGYDYGY